MDEGQSATSITPFPRTTPRGPEDEGCIYVYNKATMIRLSAAHLSRTRPACLPPDFDSEEGVWSPDLWLQASWQSNGLESHGANIRRKQIERIKSDHLDTGGGPSVISDMVLSPQRKSFVTGCRGKASSPPTAATALNFSKTDREYETTIGNDGGSRWADSRRIAAGGGARGGASYGRVCSHSAQNQNGSYPPLLFQQPQQQQQESFSWRHRSDTQPQSTAVRGGGSGAGATAVTAFQPAFRRKQNSSSENTTTATSAQQPPASRSNGNPQQQQGTSAWSGGGRYASKENSWSNVGGRRGWQNHHHREEKLPEWMMDGPDSMMDTIELRGFEDEQSSASGKSASRDTSEIGMSRKHQRENANHRTGVVSSSSSYEQQSSDPLTINQEQMVSLLGLNDLASAEELASMLGLTGIGPSAADGSTLGGDGDRLFAATAAATAFDGKNSFWDAPGLGSNNGAVLGDVGTPTAGGSRFSKFFGHKETDEDERRDGERRDRTSPSNRRQTAQTTISTEQQAQSAKAATSTTANEERTGSQSRQSTDRNPPMLQALFAQAQQHQKENTTMEQSSMQNSQPPHGVRPITKGQTHGPTYATTAAGEPELPVSQKAISLEELERQMKQGRRQIPTQQTAKGPLHYPQQERFSERQHQQQTTNMLQPPSTMNAVAKTPSPPVTGKQPDNSAMMAAVAAQQAVAMQQQLMAAAAAGGGNPMMMAQMAAWLQQQRLNAVAYAQQQSRGAVPQMRAGGSAVPPMISPDLMRTPAWQAMVQQASNQSRQSTDRNPPMLQALFAQAEQHQMQNTTMEQPSMHNNSLQQQGDRPITQPQTHGPTYPLGTPGAGGQLPLPQKAISLEDLERQMKQGRVIRKQNDTSSPPAPTTQPNQQQLAQQHFVASLAANQYATQQQLAAQQQQQYAHLQQPNLAGGSATALQSAEEQHRLLMQQLQGGDRRQMATQQTAKGNPLQDPQQQERFLERLQVLQHQQQTPNMLQPPSAMNAAARTPSPPVAGKQPDNSAMMAAVAARQAAAMQQQLMAAAAAGGGNPMMMAQMAAWLQQQRLNAVAFAQQQPRGAAPQMRAGGNAVRPMISPELMRAPGWQAMVQQAASAMFGGAAASSGRSP